MEGQIEQLGAAGQPPVETEQKPQQQAAAKSEKQNQKKPGPAEGKAMRTGGKKKVSTWPPRSDS
jgi:hypothetical protein